MDWDWTVKVTDIAIVAATLLGPIFAVQAQSYVDSRREERRRRLGVFHSLMRTRAQPVSPEHVNALNAVPLEFQGDSVSLKAVRSAWRIYINHFSKDTAAPTWGERRLELLTALLQRMGESLKYELDAVEIERDAYAPSAHGQAAAEQEIIRKGVAAMFRGEGTLPLAVKSMPSDPVVQTQLLESLVKLNKFLGTKLRGDSEGEDSKQSANPKEDG